MAWSDDDDLDSEFEFFRDKPISWSYSKYLAAFKKEQVLTRTDLPELCGMVEALQLTELPQVTNSGEDGEDGETGSLGDDHVSILSLKNADLGNSGKMHLIDCHITIIICYCFDEIPARAEIYVEILAPLTPSCELGYNEYINCTL